MGCRGGPCSGGVDNPELVVVALELGHGGGWCLAVSVSMLTSVRGGPVRGGPVRGARFDSNLKVSLTSLHVTTINALLPLQTRRA